ncbi:MAG TPA: tRNA (adenosine(37)-N6)-threonylcarbamoyltransferase complex dimerization subunit type 1 TsaB [Vicinamibacterales bacterium]
MLILALDTSSAAGSAAVVRDDVIIVERSGDPSRTHGERLPRELMAVLDAAGAGLRDVDGFAVSTGPGSFTGLRVGIATVQGLALAQGKLVTPVSAFEAVARSEGRGARGEGPGERSEEPGARGEGRGAIGVWIDAHRGEVFATLFDARHELTELATPTSLKPDATLDAWAAALSSFERVRFAGDGAVKYRDVLERRLGSRAVIDHDVPPLAGTIGLLAAADAGRAVRPHAIAPLYVRRPDAVLSRERRAAVHEPE